MNSVKPEKLKIVITRATCINGKEVFPKEIVNAPFDDAKLLISMDKAELFRAKAEPEVSAKVYTMDELSDMSIGDLRDIGKPYGVTDNKKDDLILKILDAQGE